MELVFATNNPHKLDEVRNLVGDKINILSLADIDLEGDIPETGNTLDDNALQKARFIHERTGRNCFSDDTGLEIAALDGRPGVYSARYAGPNCSAEDNMTKVLGEMDGEENRSACFRTVIALILDGRELLFQGEVAGSILTERQGAEGFGYDPIFLPEGFEHSFAEMTQLEKNKISHRGRAGRKLAEFLIGLAG